MDYRFKWLLATLLLTALCAVQMLGQSSIAGDISGTVTDPSGAVVSGATVTAKSLETDVTQTTTSSSSGAFRFPLMKPGQYKLTVSQTGFKTVAQTIQLGVGQALTANLKLELGQASETLEVSGAAPLIQTENANLETTFNATQIENLPNGGNDITAYAQTAPGVLMNSSSGGGYGNFTAFGLPATSNLFTVNGNDEMDPYLNLNNSGATNLLLGAAEVDEVGVTSNGYTGQYGRMAGAQVNYNTKSGTNTFHGGLKYWYNDVSLNAADWFLNFTHTKPGFDINNQYAASIGGPIKKDKLFFFVGTEGLRYVLATSSKIFVPTPAFQSAVLGNIGNPASPNYLPTAVPFYNQIFNLYNNAPGAGAAVPDTTPGAGGDCGDAAGTQINGVTFGDASTTPGAIPCGASYQSTVGALSTEWLMYGKVDWVHTNNDKWSVRVKSDHGLQPTYTDFLTPALNATSNQPAYEGQLTNTHVFNPNLVNQFIGSVFWYSAIFKQTNSAASVQAMPYAIYDFTGTFGNTNNLVFAGGEQNVFPQGRNVTQYQLVDDISWTKGNHGLKFGFNFRRDDITDAIFGVRSIPRARIFSIVDFSDGFIDQFSQRFPQNLEERLNMYSIGFYGQDEWRVTPKLKLTLTLRADRNSNVTCPGHCFSLFFQPFDQLNHDPTIPLNQMIQNNRSTAFREVQPLVAEPRFGFAYNLLHNTVLRGGIGMFSDLYPGTLADNFAAQAPFDTTFTLAGLPLTDPTQVGSPTSTVAGCNSAYQTAFSSGGTLADFLAAAPGGCRAPDYHDAIKHLKNPTYVEWNFELQQQIGNRSSVSLNYVGNHGYDEFIFNDLANSRDTNDFGLPIPAGQQSPSGLPAAYPDTRIRNLNFLSNGGVSNYNGLTATFSQRAFYGLQFSLSYTWSHALDYISNGGVLPYSGNDSLGEVSNPILPKAINYSNADYDVRHNFSANYVWQIPTHYHGWMDRVLGGWTLSGTWFARSGYPFTMQDTGMAGIFGNSTGFAAGFSPQPYLLSGGIPDCSGHNQTTGCFGSGTTAINNWGDFNNPNFFPGAAPNPAIWDGSFGHTKRNAFRGPHYFNSDFSVMKNFKVTERVAFGLGANMYNVFNHPNFANPNHDLASPATVGISTATVEPPTSPYGAFVGSAVSGRVIQLHGELKF